MHTHDVLSSSPRQPKYQGSRFTLQSTHLQTDHTNQDNPTILLESYDPCWGLILTISAETKKEAYRNSDKSAYCSDCSNGGGSDLTDFYFHADFLPFYPCISKMSNSSLTCLKSINFASRLKFLHLGFIFRSVQLPFLGVFADIHEIGKKSLHQLHYHKSVWILLFCSSHIYVNRLLSVGANELLPKGSRFKDFTGKLLMDRILRYFHASVYPFNSIINKYKSGTRLKFLMRKSLFFSLFFFCETQIYLFILKVKFIFKVQL